MLIPLYYQNIHSKYSLEVEFFCIEINNTPFYFDFEEDKCEIEKKEAKGITLIKKGKREIRYELDFGDEERRNTWFAKMQKTIEISKEYTRTHGIEINHQMVEHPIVKQKIPSQGHLDLSIWDFAGQQEYYNSHHYFLQNRSIFLILWKMNEPKD